MGYATVAQGSGADPWPVHLLTITMILAACAFLVLVAMSAILLVRRGEAADARERTGSQGPPAE